MGFPICLGNGRASVVYENQSRSGGVASHVAVAAAAATATACRNVS